MHAHKTLSLLILFFLSFSPSLLSKSCMYIWVLFKLLSRCLSLSLSLTSLSISCSLCFMWFVVCPKLELFKSHNTEPFTPGKAKEGGTKPARERINQESRWRRVCAKLQTGVHHTLSVLARKILTTWSALLFLTTWQACNGLIYPFRSGVRTATL